MLSNGCGENIQNGGVACCQVGKCGIFDVSKKCSVKRFLGRLAAVFRGINALHIDTKGRVGIPTKYREQLLLESNNAVVLTIDTEERCLLMYPIVEWVLLEAKLASLPSFNPAARRIQRLLIGHASDLEVDKQGRILLPALLREYAGLDKKAVLVGQGKKFELWDEAHWEESRRHWLEQESNSDDLVLPEEVKSISL